MKSSGKSYLTIKDWNCDLNAIFDVQSYLSKFEDCFKSEFLSKSNAIQIYVYFPFLKVTTETLREFIQRAKRKPRFQVKKFSHGWGRYARWRWGHVEVQVIRAEVNAISRN